MGMKHPITNKPINYELSCKTCVHFNDKTRSNRGIKTRTTTCALDPEHRNLPWHVTMWSALPACTSHKAADQ
jgi:hypothetical protein